METPVLLSFPSPRMSLVVAGGKREKREKKEKGKGKGLFYSLLADGKEVGWKKKGKKRREKEGGEVETKHLIRLRPFRFLEGEKKERKEKKKKKKKKSSILGKNFPLAPAIDE